MIKEETMVTRNMMTIEEELNNERDTTLIQIHMNVIEDTDIDNLSDMKKKDIEIEVEITKGSINVQTIATKVVCSTFQMKVIIEKIDEIKKNGHVRQKNTIELKKKMVNVHQREIKKFQIHQENVTNLQLISLIRTKMKNLSKKRNHALNRLEFLQNILTK